MNNASIEKVTMNVVEIEHKINDTSSILKSNSKKKSELIPCMAQFLFFESETTGYLFAFHPLNIGLDIGGENFELLWLFPKA